MSEATATAGLRARWLLLSGNSRGALWMPLAIIESSTRPVAS